MNTIKVLDQGFLQLIDVMGNDQAITQAARVSYGNDLEKRTADEDRNLIRYMMRHGHTSPFEMVEFKFCVQVPMDCWRQWIRHRTASVNEYSTRYSEALDFFQRTEAVGWRLQSTQNKQGSSGWLESWPDKFEVIENDSELSVGFTVQGQEFSYLLPMDWYQDIGFEVEPENGLTPGAFLTWLEYKTNKDTKQQYDLRLLLGVAKEQARKDLPLSNYTRAYWKCDLHNILGFLRQRMDSHAQQEIRSFANAMAVFVEQQCPITWEAFIDYQLNAMKLTRLEIEALKFFNSPEFDSRATVDGREDAVNNYLTGLFTNKREREECLNKLTKLNVL